MAVEMEMQVFGYIFLARDKNLLQAEAEQAAAIVAYVQGLGLPPPRLVVEENGTVKRPFRGRPAAAPLLAGLAPGDLLVVARAAWVLSSAAEGERLLQQLRAAGVALHCLDIGGNISLPEKRRLQVFEGPAEIVAKILAALNTSDNDGHGRAIRSAKRHGKEQGKYLGGPVPFGWEVAPGGYLAPHEGQQRIIEAMRALHQDRWSYREISRKLEKEYGVRLSHEGVRRLCKGGGKGKPRRGREASNEEAGR